MCRNKAWVAGGTLNSPATMRHEVCGGFDPANKPSYAQCMVGGGIWARGAQLVLLWLSLSFGLFALVHTMPGSPEEQLLATHPNLSAKDLTRLRHLRGLDLPLGTRYRCWLLGRADVCPDWPTDRGVMTGDLGWSLVHRAPVLDLLKVRLPNTLALMGPAFILGLLGALGLGGLSALRPGSRWDQAVAGLTTFGLAVPAHWLGLLLIGAFAIGLNWLPAGGVDSLQAPSIGSRLLHLVLPVSVLSVYYLARWTRYVRAALIEELSAPYLDTARALGLSEPRVVLTLALPNALFPLVTVVGQSIPVLLSGALIIERVFSYPGMGLLIFDSVQEHDHLVAVTIFVLYAGLTFAASAFADIAYYWLDPRARASKGAP